MAVIAVIGTGTSFLLINNETEELVVERVPIPIPDLHPSLEGFRIVQLSDIHMLPLTQPEFIHKAVDLANSLAPDLIVLTGDYVWRDAETIHQLSPILAKLNARHGVYASLGNHDLWTDVDIVLQGLKDARIPVLVNRGIPVSSGKGKLYLAGLDDAWSGRPDLNSTLQEAPNGSPVILLGHEPDLADQWSLDGRVTLQLAGHSHGGQIRYRGNRAFLLPYLAWKYDMGLYRINGMWLYTNRGLGVTNIPVRYKCPPEITEITLLRS